MQHKIFLILLFLLLTWSSTSAQLFNEKHFTRYTARDGLSDNSVSGIAQDQRGFIWLSTLSGVNRYNGSRFVNFRSSADSLSPASDESNGMSWLDHERLAIYTSGLHIINTRTGETRNVFIPYHERQYAYKFNMITAASGDSAGNIFVLTRSGFYHFDARYRLVFRFDYYPEDQVATEHFFFGRELLQLDRRHLMITSLGGIYIYDKDTKDFKPLTKNRFPLLAEFLDGRDRFCRFFQLKQGHFLVAKSSTDSLLYINQPENKKTVSRTPFLLSADIIHYRSKLLPVKDHLAYLTDHTAGFYKVDIQPVTGAVKLSPGKFFDTHLVNALLVDRENQLWLATNKGLFREDAYHAQLEVALLPASLDDAFPNIRIGSVYATKDKVYAGTRSRGGLLQFDKKTFQYEKQYLFDYHPLVNNIHKIVPLCAAVLLGTGGPLIRFNPATGQSHTLAPPLWTTGDWTQDLNKDSRGYTWISASHIYRYNDLDEKFSLVLSPQKMPAIPVAIEEDRSGNFWVAGHGLIRYNNQLNTFDFELDSFPYIKMPDKQVTAMTIDSRNTIWFASGNNGLIGYDIAKKTYRHFTRSHGLPDDNISSLIVIGNKLWIASYSGVACLDIPTSQIKSFGKDEGFPEMPVMRSSRFYYDSAEQRLYLGHYNAVVRFNPHSLLSIQNRPAVFIESVRVSGEKEVYLPANEITTSWRNNDVAITIGSINFPHGNTQGYAYRIARKPESPWQQLGTQPSFNISNLPAGEHRIQVKIFSLNKRWSEQIHEFTIRVHPPFWQTTAFRVLAALLALLFIYFLIRWRTAVARKKEMQKTQVEKLKADDFKNRLELEQISNFFSYSLADKKTVDEVLWDVAGNLIGRMNYVDCMIYLWNPDKSKMIQKAAFGPKGKPEFIQSNVFDVIPGQGVVGHVIQTKEPVLVRDTRIDSRYRVDEASRLSEICVPIIHNNELLGVIDSEHHEVNYFKERDIQILTTIATLLGNKLKQLESEQTLELKTKELHTINEQLAEAKLSALQAQMNPHFIFNALNSIKRMILDGDNEKASRYLSKFAQMIRMTLNQSKDTLVTLHENIEYLHTYLDMEQLRFDGSFTWSLEVSDNIDPAEIHIPSLMMQPLVENAIWHGLLPAEGEKKLNISFHQESGRVTCIIEDNGIGIKRSEALKTKNNTYHRSVGLENLRNRINILNEKYQLECVLTITDMTGTAGDSAGTRVVLAFNAYTL